MTSSKTFPFHSFAAPGCPINPTGNFNENLSLYLQECTEGKESNFVSPTWCTVLFHEKSKSLVPLYTIEENVRSSSSPFTCQHCTHAGWGGHLVSKSRYHLIIPDDDDWIKTLGEDQLVLENGSHLLHGVLHSNGYGHLLRINGIEGGSKRLTGRETMELWDRICTNLRTRKVSVIDTSSKTSMDLKLLHGIAYKRSWFGRWGYVFSHGSFGVTKAECDAALENLRSLRVDDVLKNFVGMEFHRQSMEIVNFYRDRFDGDTITMEELIRYILSSRVPDRARVRDLNDVAHADKFPTATVVEVGEVIATVLNGSRGCFSRSELQVEAEKLLERGKSRLPHVLSVMHNVKVGNQIVRRTWSGQHFDYRIHNATEPGLDVYIDLQCLYHNVLLPSTDSQAAIQSGKHFVKEWPLRSETSEKVTIVCSFDKIEVYLGDIESAERACGSPGVIVQVSPDSTLEGLKEVAARCLREAYFLSDHFSVTEIRPFLEMADGDSLFGLLETVSQIFVTGMEMDTLRYQDNNGDLKVDCICRAAFDDGEDMLPCTVCKTRKHRTCMGDAAGMAEFLCPGCVVSLRNQIIGN